MSKNISRRNFVEAGAATAAALGAFGLAGCSSNQVESSTGSAESEEDSQESTKISEMSEEELEAAWQEEEAYDTTLTVVYAGNMCMSGFAMANHLGYYADEGLDVEIISGTDAKETVGTGKAVMGGSHIADLLVPATNGVGITLVTPIQTGCQSLYVLSDSEYESTADLVGKTIGCPAGIGSHDQNIVMRYLQRDGIDVDSVEYKAVDQDAAVLALQNDEIQATTLGDQYAYEFVQAGTIRYIRSLTYDEDFADEPCCCVCVNTEFLEANPITSYKLVKAVSEANHWIGENTEEAAEIIIENDWGTGDIEIAEHFLPEWNFEITDEDCEEALRDIIADYLDFELFDDNDEDVDTILSRVWYPVLES